MTKAEQYVLLDAFLESMAASLISKVPQMPLDWDGFELRQFVADAFAREASIFERQPRARKQAYLRAANKIS